MCCNKNNNMLCCKMIVRDLKVFIYVFIIKVEFYFKGLEIKELYNIYLYFW